MGERLAPRAKPPTPEEAQQRRDQMHELNEAIKASMVEGRAAIWKLAAYLDVWDDQVGWSALGYESQNDWLADPDIGITKSTFHRLVDTYRFLQQRQVDPKVIQQLEQSKIYIAIPAVKQGRANLEDVIDDVQQLGYRDLREKYRDPAAGTSASTSTPDKPAPDGESVSEVEVVDELHAHDDSRHKDQQPIYGANQAVCPTCNGLGVVDVEDVQ